MAESVPSPSDPLYIFISYARPQQAIAEQVEAAMRGAGLRIFRDTSDIRSGAHWDMTIEKALHEADRMVLLLSSASMPYRKEVHREWFFFDQERKPIYPLYVEDCELHSRMYVYNYIDARTDLTAAIEKLLAEIQREYVLPGDPTGADRILVVENAEVRTLPEAMNDLLKAIRDPKGSIALTPELTDEMVKRPPESLTEYRLGRIVEWARPRYQLDNRFVNLTLLLDQGEEAQQRWLKPESSRKFNDLRDVLAEYERDPAFVILGAPGSGKSTLLRRLQLDHEMDRLRDEGERLSFFIQLNKYSLGSPMPREWLGKEWQRDYPNLPPLEDLLNRGQILLLLDALNEMPHKNTTEYHERVGLWRSFIQDVTRTGNRVIFSCRSLDYSASLSSKELRVPQVQVQPMSAEQVQDFLAAYLPAQADMIWEELDGSPQFGIFQTPYFLKLLVDQVDATSEIPAGRASLFTGFVRQALQREIVGGHALFLPDSLLTERDHRRLTNNQWRNPFELPERGILLPALSKLAFNMQQDANTDSGQIRLDYDDACIILAQDRDEDILKAGVALNVLDEDVAQQEILFFHQLLQEFFAARALSQKPDPELVRTPWQVDQVKPALEKVLETLPDSDPLPGLPQTGWEETTLLAAAMSADPDAFVRDLMSANLELAARCTAAPEVTISEALKGEIQQGLIARSQDFANADLRARIAAGLALGEVGDPRMERRSGPHGDYLLPPLVDIPAGTYPLGTDDSQYDGEKPAHTVELKAFQIGKFPVTNAEYALFMAAGGYEDEQWWDTDEALAWLRGEGSTDGQKQQWRDNKKTFESWSENTIHGLVTQNRITSKQANDWIIIRNWSTERFEEWLEDIFPSGKVYRQPEYWEDNGFNNPAQPVVGVTWFEARAYCKWLSAQTGQTYELPSEAQFEAAARGVGGRLYPYGDVFEVQRSNTFESHIRRTTPIGIFENATPEGAVDLSGNAYTWTTSIYDPERFSYPYRAEDGREDLNASARRVLRGGSWYYNYDNARAVFRFSVNPSLRYNNFGFRVLRPPSRES